MEELSAETLFVKFKTQLESLEKLKHDFADVHGYMQDVMDKFHKSAQDNAKKTMNANKEMLDETESHAKKASGSIGQSMNEIGNALGINLGKFATVAGGVLSVLSFGDELRRIAHNQIQAEGLIQGSTGAGTMDQVGQLGKFQANMATRWGLFGLGSPEEVAKVSGKLLMTPGMGSANLFGEGGTTEQAMLMGRSTGLGSENVAGMFSDMVRKMNVSATNVGEVFADLVEKGKSVGSVNGQYVQTVLNITSALKTYGVDLDTVSNATHKFWHDIEKGRMSVEDLTKAFTVGRTSNEGQRAFMASEIFSKDPKLAHLFNSDTLTNMQRAGEVLEGKEGFINGHQVTNEQRNQAMRDIFQNAQSMARDALKQGGMQETPENLRFFEQHFLQTTSGINFKNLSQHQQDKMFETFRTGDFAAGKGLMQAAKSNEFEQLMRIGNLLGGLEKGPLERIAEMMSHLTTMVGGFLAGGMVPFLPDNVKKLAQDIAGEYTPGVHAFEKYSSGRIHDDEGRDMRRNAVDYLKMASNATSGAGFNKRIHAMDQTNPEQAHLMQEILRNLQLNLHVDLSVDKSGRIVHKSELNKELNRLRFNLNSWNFPNTPTN